MHPLDPDPETPPPLWLPDHICTEPLKITYEIDPVVGCIKFRPCGFASWRASDINKRYCPFCDRYMDLIDVAREVTEKYSR